MNRKIYSDLQEILEAIDKVSSEKVLHMVSQLENGKLKNQSLSKKIYRAKKASEWERWVVLGLAQFIWRSGIEVSDEID